MAKTTYSVHHSLDALERFIKRSRVKPTDGQIEFVLDRLEEIREHIRSTATVDLTVAAGKPDRSLE